MKSLYNKIFVIIALTGCIVLAGCEKKKEILAPWVNAGMNSNYAHLRILHLSPNFRLATGKADSIHVFANGVKLNGARMTYGGAWPALTPTSYIGVSPGTVDLRVSVGGLVNLDSIPVTTLKVNMEKGKFYSFIITDSILNASKDSTRIFTRDSFPLPAEGRIGLRFVNSLVDSASNKRVNVWSTRRNNYLFTNVLSGTVTAFSNQPYLNYPDTLIVHRSGTTTEMARINNVTFANTRVYTLYLRGDVKLTGTKARAFGWYLNR